MDEGRDNGVPWMEEGAAVAGEILIHLTLGNSHSFGMFFGVSAQIVFLEIHYQNI